MARTKISEFSATPGNNTDIDGINIAEGCAPSGINDAIRELMSQLKDFQAGTAGDSFNGPVGTTTAAAGAFTTLSASSTVSGTGFSTYLASPPAIGGTAAAAGSFTTLSASSTVTLSGGTANGVLYLNASKVATSGSALTFSGTSLAITGNFSSSNAGSENYFLNDGATRTSLQQSSNALYYNVNDNSATNGAFIWRSSNAYSELMRLTSTGLGIGTSSPGQKLDVSGADGVRARVIATAGGTPGLILSSSGNTAYTIKAGNADNSLRIDQDGTDRITLASGGNLGIGTSSPGYKLHVAASGSTAGYFTSTGSVTTVDLDNTNANGWGGNIAFRTGGTAAGYFGTIGSLLGNTTQDLAVYATSGNGFRVYTNGNNLRAIFDSSGNLGLGVTPSAWSSSWKAFQFGSVGAAFSNSSNAIWSGNEYLNTGGTPTYLTSQYALRYRQDVGSGYHAWYNAVSGTAGNTISWTQAMTLDASGRLGIGTTDTASFGRTLIVNGTGGFNNDSGTVGIAFSKGASTTYGYIGTGDWAINGLAAADFGISSGSTGALVFGTNITERARITSGGYFKASNTGSYQGSTSGYHELRTDNNTYIAYFTNSNAAPNGTVIEYGGAAPNGTGNLFLYCGDTGGERASVRSNGGLANYSGNNVNLSDRREKTNFAPAKSYLDTICAIPVQTFNYIDQNMEDDPGLTLGVVAQDVQAVAPELVSESNWGTEEDPKMRLSIYQTDLQYALMKCIQELKSELDSVKAELATLKGN